MAIELGHTITHGILIQKCLRLNRGNQRLRQDGIDGSLECAIERTANYRGSACIAHKIALLQTKIRRNQDRYDFKDVLEVTRIHWAYNFCEHAVCG